MIARALLMLLMHAPLLLLLLLLRRYVGLAAQLKPGCTRRGTHVVTVAPLPNCPSTAGTAPDGDAAPVATGAQPDAAAAACAGDQG